MISQQRFGKNADGSVLREAAPHHILPVAKGDLVKDDTGDLFQNDAVKTYITKYTPSELKITCSGRPF